MFLELILLYRSRCLLSGAQRPSKKIRIRSPLVSMLSLMIDDCIDDGGENCDDDDEGADHDDEDGDGADNDDSADVDHDVSSP